MRKLIQVLASIFDGIIRIFLQFENFEIFKQFMSFNFAGSCETKFWTPNKV